MALDWAPNEHGAGNWELEALRAERLRAENWAKSQELSIELGLSCTYLAGTTPGHLQLHLPLLSLARSQVSILAAFNLVMALATSCRLLRIILVGAAGDLSWGERPG